MIFQARLSSSIYPLGSNQIITYDSTVINLGSAYDTLTGMFDAPVGGLYQFMATMWPHDGYNLDFQMMFNGHEVCAGRTTSRNQSMGICSAILQIPSGGRVFFRHKKIAVATPKVQTTLNLRAIWLCKLTIGSVSIKFLCKRVIYEKQKEKKDKK